MGLLYLWVALQQLGVVPTYNAAHVGHALVGHFHCVSGKEFSEWVAYGEGSVNDSQELFTHIGLDC